MTGDDGPSWDDLEGAVRRETRKADGAEMALAARLVDHLTDGLRRATEDLKQAREAGQKDVARQLVLLITTAACNSLSAAFDLCSRGYYAQAQSLTRNAYESWLAGAYVHFERTSVAKLQKKSSEWPRPAKMRYVVANSIAQNAKESQRFQGGFGKMYDRLSKLTHPTFDSVSSVLDDEGCLHIGPFFSSNRLVICCDDAYRTATLLHYLLEESFPSLRRTAWSSQNDALAQEVNAWTKEALPETRA